MDTATSSPPAQEAREPAAPPVRSPSVPAWAGAALGTLTFLAYLPGAGRSLDFDSAQTVGMFVRPGPPWAAFTRQAVFNNHPFFSFLEQLVRVVTGRTDAATVRILPILFGAAAVGVLTWFAARRHGLPAGLVAGALLAANPTFAGLSRSVRGYSLLVLCAVVATVLVADDRRGLAYSLVAGVGLATHLYMLPVVAAHVGAVAVRHRLGDWRMRFAGAVAVAAVAYAGMAAAMMSAADAHARVFRPGFPWRVAVMATGGRWAAAVAAPLVVAGAVLLLRRSRASRGAAVALGAALVVLWAGLQSSALTERFFVWLVPGAAYLAAVAVGRFRPAALAGAVSAALAVSVATAGATADPTGYKEAATLVHRAAAAGMDSCVVNIGVPPMLAYLDSPEDFRTVTDPAQLEGCDLLLVTAWWPTEADWYSRDRAVIAAAEAQYPYRQVIAHGDRVLVLATRPV